MFINLPNYINKVNCYALSFFFKLHNIFQGLPTLLRAVHIYTIQNSFEAF